MVNIDNSLIYLLTCYFGKFKKLLVLFSIKSFFHNNFESLVKLFCPKNSIIYRKKMKSALRTMFSMLFIMNIMLLALF